jgi:hypothetical protein
MFPIHAIPLWFLVLSLFLPRICILIAWFQHSMPQFIPNPASILGIVIAVLVPRILIMFWVYQDQGIGFWLALHVIAFLFAWGSGGRRLSRRSGD